MMVTVPIWVFVIMAGAIVAQIAAARAIIDKSQKNWRLYKVAKKSLLRANLILHETARGPRVSEDVLVLVEDAIETGLDEVEAELVKLEGED